MTDQLNPFGKELWRKIISSQGGAALVEFALIANLVIILNVAIYDISSFYRLSERSKHAGQSVQRILSADRDHQLTFENLVQMNRLVESVMSGEADPAASSLVVMDVMPYLPKAKSTWEFIVCWSWSSDPANHAAPKIGSGLSQAQYNLNTWAPVAGSFANAAILIVEIEYTNNRLFDFSVIPNVSRQRSIGPVRYQPSVPVNLMLYNYSGGQVQNDAKTVDINASNATLCQR